MAANKLDIDIIIELIIEGATFRQIAEKLNVKLTTLHDFTSKNEHSARISRALEISAQTYEEKAEQILINAEASAYEMQRARELAQHYRWKAAKRSPRKYGEKVDLSSSDGSMTPKNVNLSLMTTEELLLRADITKKMKEK